VIKQVKQTNKEQIHLATKQDGRCQQQNKPEQE
jgi:hypothetical protein